VVTTTAIHIPSASDDDRDDVQCALTVARASWERGDHRDALKWLRRAAQMAAEGDALLRAIALSKAAAEVAAALDRPSVIEPPKLHPKPRARPRPKLASDLEKTSPRLPPSAYPSPDFELAKMFEDDLDEPTAVRKGRKSDDHALTRVQLQLPDSNPFALDRRVDDEPSSDEPSAPRISSPASLSATRIAVIPGARGGRPEVVFLPPGAVVPHGAAVAMIVPQSSDDAALLSTMLRVFQDVG
jgi:hypothetical protein